MYNSKKSILLKVAMIWLVFAMLHYANNILPNPVLAFLGEKPGFESVFGHSKMNFWSYLIVTLGEFVFFRKKITDLIQYGYTRMLSAVVFPWFALTFWMTGSALNGGLEPARPIELSFSLLSIVFAAYLTVRLEQAMEEIRFRTSTRLTILFFFLITLVQYVSFEMNAPWWNYFGTN
jgi:hypothetical protein